MDPGRAPSITSGLARVWRRARRGVQEPPEHLGCGCRPGCGCFIGTLWLVAAVAAGAAAAASRRRA